MGISERDFGRLEAKVDAILDRVAELKQDGTDIHNDFEGRIRGLERWRWGIPGTFIAAFAAALVTALT